MTTVIKPKRSVVPESIPTAGQLEVGEIAINIPDGKFYTKDGSGVVKQVGGAGVGYTGSQGIQGVQGYTGSQGTSGSRTYTVTNSGASAYTIDGASNPTLNLLRGFTYTFNVNASGHPFWIKTSQVTGTGSAYSNGVTNNGTASGTITFAVPYDAPSTLYYICQFHGVMVGTISITDVGPTGYTGSKGDTGSQGIQGVTGFTGSQGIQGAQGYTGSAGSGVTDSLVNGIYTVQLDSNGILNLPQTAYIYDDTTTFATTSANQTLDSFSAAVYRAAKYVIQAISDSDIHATELLVMHNDSTVFKSQTNTIYSSSSLISLDASIVSGNVVVTVTPANADTVVDFVRTSLLSRVLGGFNFEGDLQSLTGAGVDLETLSGSVDLNEEGEFNFEGDLQFLTGNIDLESSTGTEDLLAA